MEEPKGQAKPSNFFSFCLDVTIQSNEGEQLLSSQTTVEKLCQNLERLFPWIFP